MSYHATRSCQHYRRCTGKKKNAAAVRRQNLLVLGHVIFELQTQGMLAQRVPCFKLELRIGFPDAERCVHEAGDAGH